MVLILAWQFRPLGMDARRHLKIHEARVERNQRNPHLLAPSTKRLAAPFLLIRPHVAPLDLVPATTSTATRLARHPHPQR